MATTKAQPKATPPPAPEAKPKAAPATPPPPRTIREERLALGGKRKRSTTKTDVNPLREGLRLERVPDPHILVLFGSTGDLSHRKVFPALAQLWRTNLLPADWSLIAIGRRPYDDGTFRMDIAESLHRNCRVQLDEEAEHQFLERVFYHRGDFGDDRLY